MKVGRLAELAARQRESGDPYLEFVREESMSVGLYVLPVGGTDRQMPHSEDEVYVVLSGRCRFTSGGRTRDVQAGDTIFVPAAEAHRFHDIEEELRVMVVFAPAEGTYAG